MKVRLKKLDEQVVVLTGASSGIGRATARLAGERGARLVLNSRDEADLGEAATAIRKTGAQVVTFAGDVADQPSMERLADTAITEFGRIDTWINNAGVTIYGRIEEVSLDDARRLFETNYWGMVHGTLAALPHLKQHGGALINVGSVLSETGYPLQGHYAASKHAVKGFTDSLRIELEHAEVPVAVTLIQPSAIDTPYAEHAENYMGVVGKHIPPVYEPEVVAKAILTCAERSHRNVIVGAAKMFQTIEHMAPGLGDWMKKKVAVEGTYSDELAANTSTLHAPRTGDARERGRHPGHVANSSVYTGAVLHPARTLATIAAIGAAAVIVNRSGMFGGRD